MVRTSFVFGVLSATSSVIAGSESAALLQVQGRPIDNDDSPVEFQVRRHTQDKVYGKTDVATEECATELITDLTNVPRFNAEKDRILMFASPKTASTLLKRLFHLPSILEKKGQCRETAWDANLTSATWGSCDTLLETPKLRTHSWTLAQRYHWSRKDDTTFAIAPIRHAVARSVSNFFQRKYRSGLPDGKEDREKLFEEFIGELLNSGEDRDYISKFKAALGVDLNSFVQRADFSKEGGLFLKTTCPSANKTIITALLRVEDLEQNRDSWKNNILKFFSDKDLDLDDEEVNSENGAYAAADKAYADIYLEFKSFFRRVTTPAFCQQFTGLDESSTFYSELEGTKLISEKCGHSLMPGSVLQKLVADADVAGERAAQVAELEVRKEFQEDRADKNANQHEEAEARSERNVEMEAEADARKERNEELLKKAAERKAKNDALREAKAAEMAERKAHRKAAKKR